MTRWRCDLASGTFKSMGIANGIRKQARKIAIEREMRLSASWANSLKAATEQMESTAPVRRVEKDGLDIVSAWALIGIFLMLAIAGVYLMSTILIPVTLAVVVGMILGLLAEKLSKLGVRASSTLFFCRVQCADQPHHDHSLAGPLSSLAKDGPDVVQQTIDRLMPFMQRIKWAAHHVPQTFQSEADVDRRVSLDNTGSILHVVPPT